MARRTQMNEQEMQLVGKTEKQVLKAYESGKISAVGVQLVLGLSVRKTYQLLNDRGIARDRVGEMYARMNRSAGKGAARVQPSKKIVEALFQEHMAGNITQIEAAKKLSISQQNFSVRFLRWRVKKLEVENTQLRQKLDQATEKSPASPTGDKSGSKPRRRPNFSLTMY